MNSNPTRKKRRVRKTQKTSPKRFAGQALKGDFEWANWSFAIKALTEQIGLQKCWEAIPAAVQLVSLKKLQNPVRKIPDPSVLCQEADSLGSDLVIILLEKIGNDCDLNSSANASAYLESLGKAIGALICRPRPDESRRLVTQCYAKARNGRLLPPTSRMVENACCTTSIAFSDATSDIRKKIKRFSLQLTPSKKKSAAIKLISDQTQAHRASNKARLKKKVIEILGCPTDWPLADLYEGIIWKTCPSEIFEILISEKNLWAGFERWKVFPSPNTRREAMEFMSLIRQESFDNSGKLFESSLGAIHIFKRKEPQSTFRRAIKDRKFKGIPEKLIANLKKFLEECLWDEVQHWSTVDNCSAAVGID